MGNTAAKVKSSDILMDGIQIQIKYVSPVYLYYANGNMGIWIIWINEYRHIYKFAMGNVICWLLKGEMFRKILEYKTINHKKYINNLGITYIW
jgi:hypothetical protein